MPFIWNGTRPDVTKPVFGSNAPSGSACDLGIDSFYSSPVRSAFANLIGYIVDFTRELKSEKYIENFNLPADERR